MDCRIAREQIGPWLDGELPPEQVVALQNHLASCLECARELKETRELVGELTAAAAANRPLAPPELWPAVQRRLRHSQPRRRALVQRVLHRPLAVAASLAVLLGAGVFTTVLLTSTPQTAQATTIDYRLLLDGLPDVDGSVDRFLAHYGARQMDAATIQAMAAPLQFNLPAALPGEFRLQSCYRLQFGSSPGFAARYHDGSAPLFVFFHTPVANTQMGVHRDSECAVAGKEGHCIQVGGWRLIHFTDPTTCHCLLSNLEESKLYPILAAISPGYDASEG